MRLHLCLSLSLTSLALGSTALAGPGAKSLSASAAQTARDWHFVGTRLSKPTRIFYFYDIASAKRSGNVVTFDWTAYTEDVPAFKDEYGRWSEYSSRIDCTANTSQNFATRKIRPDGTPFPAEAEQLPKGWNGTYPVRAGDPASTFAAILCGRQQIKTLSIKGYSVPEAVASFVKQLG